MSGSPRPTRAASSVSATCSALDASTFASSADALGLPSCVIQALSPAASRRCAAPCARRSQIPLKLERAACIRQQIGERRRVQGPARIEVRAIASVERQVRLAIAHVHVACDPDAAGARSIPPPPRTRWPRSEPATSRCTRSVEAAFLSRPGAVRRRGEIDASRKLRVQAGRIDAVRLRRQRPGARLRELQRRCALRCRRRALPGRSRDRRSAPSTATPLRAFARRDASGR